MTTHLRPYPFPALLLRMFREMEVRRSIFDLPSRKFFASTGGRNLCAVVHGAHTPVPLGPAAGPHTQLAPNIILSYLAGGRVIELKTVQVKDDLDIPRPCIDMATVGYNVEWSQELRVDESLAEYAKAALAIAIVAESGIAGIDPSVRDVLFEASVGYDFAGICSDKVRGFLRAMGDAKSLIDGFRRQVPASISKYRDVPVPTKLATGVTLSTFHGCPPNEVEQIARHIMREYGLSVTIKLNPTLLGKPELMHLLHDVLGYHDIEVPDAAFDNDAKWDDVLSMVSRLTKDASTMGVGFGIKLTNTLVVKNKRDFFSKDISEAYLSGPPLHVLAIRLAAKLQKAIGGQLPISFSAGIDWSNFADVLALDFAPVTVCTDWLKPGGYGRTSRYFDELFRRMDASGASSRGDWIIRARGHGQDALSSLGLDREIEARCIQALDERTDLAAAAGTAYARWVNGTAQLNLASYADSVIASGRYARAHHNKPPKKIGTKLHLFDCITCDKCIPVCPNDANFTLPAGHMEVPKVKVRRNGTSWVFQREGILRIDEKHQLANYADHCNDCGNCDVFCPEDGGPYRIKPRFFGSIASFSTRPGDGLYVERSKECDLVLGRFNGSQWRLEARGDKILFEGNGFRVGFSRHNPEDTFDGVAQDEVDLTWFGILDLLSTAVLSRDEVNWVSCLGETQV